MEDNVYCVDSLMSFELAKHFIGRNKHLHDKIIIRITGSDPLAKAGKLLKEVERYQNSRSDDSVSIEGLPYLMELEKRSKELVTNKWIFLKMARFNKNYASSSSDEDEEDDDDEDDDEDDDDDEDIDPHDHSKDHTELYNHDADALARLENCVQNMDISAMHELDRDVMGHIRRYEHHGAMHWDTQMEARHKWIPNINRELYGDFDNSDKDADEEDEDGHGDSDDEDDSSSGDDRRGGSFFVRGGGSDNEDDDDGSDDEDDDGSDDEDDGEDSADEEEDND